MFSFNSDPAHFQHAEVHNAGIPLRHIQEISGHNDLGTWQRYLEVSPEQKKQAVSVIGW